MTRRGGVEETDLFRRLGPERLGRIRSHLKLQPYWPREYLYFEAQPAEHLWVVRSGEVRTLKAGRSGRVMTLEHLRPGDIFGVAAIVSTRLEQAHNRLCSFAHDSVPARIARLILTADPEGDKIEMTRRALGEEAGTTVETTIRVLRSFERAGWVEGGVGWVRVVDRAALARIADGAKPQP